MNDLPDVYISDDGRRETRPTYEALADCQMVMTSAETGASGPTLVLAGEHFTTDATPNHSWKPLNRAAQECFDQWIGSLPVKGNTIPQELISQAAYELRPREGDPEFPLPAWWSAVMRRAAQLFDLQRGSRLQTLAVAQRAGAQGMPVMPFASAGPVMPIEPGRAPVNVAEHQPQSAASAARRTRAAAVKPPMPGTQAVTSPQQSAG